MSTTLKTFVKHKKRHPLIEQEAGLSSDASDTQSEASSDDEYDMNDGFMVADDEIEEEKEMTTMDDVFLERRRTKAALDEVYVLKKRIKTFIRKLHEIKHEKRRWQRRAYAAKSKKDKCKAKLEALRQHAENTSQEEE
jgi:hypothetical protein